MRVQITTREPHSLWVQARSFLKGGEIRTKTFGGLGFPAYSAVLNAGTVDRTSNTIDVYKGGTELLVEAADVPLAKVAALVRKVLPAL